MYIRLKQDIIVRSISDGLFMYDLINKNSIILNSTAADIIQIIISKRLISLNTILAKISALYNEIPYETIQSDVTDCLIELKNKEFIDIVNDINQVNSGLRFLQIELTQKCNERCIHCYIPNYIKDTNLSIDPSVLIKTLEEFVKIGGEGIVLSGGEPFTYPQLPFIIDFCRNNRLKVGFLTNLIDADLDMIRILHNDGLLGIIQTSVYSVKPAVHDSITKVKDSLKRTLVNLEHLLDEGIEVSISTPIMAQNKNEIGEIIEYAKNKNIEFRANANIIEQKDGNKDFVNKYALSVDEIKDCYINLIKTYGQYAFNHILKYDECDKFFCESPEKFCNSNICSVATHSLGIDVHGNILPCPQWYKMVLGNIKYDSIEDIWCNSVNLKTIRKMNKRGEFSQCLSCDALNFCNNCLMKNASSKYSQMNIPDDVNCAIAHISKDIYESQLMNHDDAD